MKFRVVDENGIIQEGLWGIDHNGNLFKLKIMENEQGFHYNYEIDHVSRQYCTGRKDINNKEIWEGDIVRWRHAPVGIHTDCKKFRRKNKYKNKRKCVLVTCAMCSYSVEDIGKVVWKEEDDFIGFGIEPIEEKSNFGFYGPEEQNFNWNELEVINEQESRR